MQQQVTTVLIGFYLSTFLGLFSEQILVGFLNNPLDVAPSACWPPVEEVEVCHQVSPGGAAPAPGGPRVLAHHLRGVLDESLCAQRAQHRLGLAAIQTSFF